MGHINDLSAGREANAMSSARYSGKRVASIEAELERLDAMLSRGEVVNMDACWPVLQLRRLLETLDSSISNQVA